MPTTTYTPIASVTLSASASAVVFSGLPQTYRDLILVASYTGSGAAESVLISFNNDTAANYSRVLMSGSGSGAISIADTSRSFSAIYGSNLSQTTMSIFDYSATDKHKTFLTRFGNLSSSEVLAYAGRWNNTAAITSVALTPSAGTFSSGSTFNLFGVIS